MQTCYNQIRTHFTEPSNFQGLFAFHMETGVGYKVVGEVFHENEKCGLQEIQYLQVIDPWLAVQKNSSYKEMFKIGSVFDFDQTYDDFDIQYYNNPLLGFCTDSGEFKNMDYKLERIGFFIQKNLNVLEREVIS